MAIFFTAGTGAGTGEGTLGSFGTAAEPTEVNLTQVIQSSVGVCNITAVNTVDNKTCAPKSGAVSTGNLSKVKV